MYTDFLCVCSFSAGGKPVVNWYIGSVLFFFQYTLPSGSKRFLLLVDLAKRNMASQFDNTLPMVELFKKSEKRRKLAIFNFNEIDCTVGLVKCKNSNESTTYSVITSEKVFTENLGSTSGSIANI